ncbi:hypothetical protein EXW60_16460 [Bacillus mycoides]|nr:hypothetical protein EXW60_16460 [Bacillus mycoides]QWG88684.1 hypothetical protein EXW40_05755 [Bacillus mycoides]
MECFHIGEQDDNFIKVVITDFTNEGDSTLSCYIYECYEYIPSIKSQLTSFLNTFKFNGNES